ncbi:MAG: septation protein SpoVG family protein [Sulfurihydrogenibium sp.]|uniref:SpoVG family protein n=1 Tax=Sulfurihydrogenibium sp. TaxID=2053621 RepID=UPI000CAB704F|nr:MAG: stage V sporulation protein G [Sulfurihydrogenibium sp.]
MKITQVRIYPFDTGRIGGRVRAVAEIVIDDILLIRDIKVIESKHGGLFINFPKKKSSSNRFFEIVEPLSKEFAEEVRRAVLDKYKELISMNVEENFD